MTDQTQKSNKLLQGFFDELSIFSIEPAPNKPLSQIRQWSLKVKPVIRKFYQSYYDDFIHLIPPDNGWDSMESFDFFGYTQQQAWEEDNIVALETIKNVMAFLQGLLTTDESSIQKETQNSTDSLGLSPLLVVTASDLESKVVLHVIEGYSTSKATPIVKDGFVYNDLGKINNTQVFLTLSEMGSMGLGASRHTISQAIESISPKAVVMVGIAFGINEEKQGIGDVLVSNQLAFYNIVRFGKDKTLPRGDKPHASAKLIQYFRNAKLYWDTKTFDIHFGLILSGEALVDNIEIRNQLLAEYPEAIGGEMEGAGLYGACQTSNIDWIIVKAICDWADGNKGQNKDENQKIAAQNAASFFCQMLQQFH